MSAVDWLALILLWGASISRIRPARHSHEQRMLWGAFTALALSRVFSAVPVVAWMDATTGTELATLLRHLTGLASATSLLAYVEAITRHGRPSRAHWIWPTAAVVVTLLTAMFLLRGGRIYWVDGAYAPGATAVQGRIYLTVFDGWLMICLAAAGWLFAGYTRVAPPLLRVGLALSTLGMVAGVVNRAHVMVFNVATLIDPNSSWREIPVLHKTTFLICIVGITAGTSIPAWRAGMARLREMAALRDLRPLWAALIQQYPDVPLKMAVPLQSRVVRRVVEIQDGMLSLTTVVPPPSGPESHHPDEVARWVADALRAARDRAESGVPLGKIPGPQPMKGETEWQQQERETEWFRQVAIRFTQLNDRGTAPLGS